MATKDQGIFQLTFVRKSSSKRPKTSSVSRNMNRTFGIQKKFSENDPVQKMKQMKAEAKKAQLQYIMMLTNVKQSEKSINEHYKQAQQKKVSFLKLYETKKLKNLSVNLISECQTQRAKYQQQTKQNTKRMKIQEQIKKLITKQEKQTNLQKLKAQLQKEKQKFVNKKQLKSNQLYNMSRNSFLTIKKQHQQGQNRRTHIKSVSDVRSKHNYWKRVSQQILILQEYEKVIKDLELYDEFNQEIEEVRGKTSQTARSSSKNGIFLTQKR